MGDTEGQPGRAAAQGPEPGPDPAAPAAAGDRLDPRALANLTDLLGGGPDALRELIDEFLDRYGPRLLASLQEALDRGDASGVGLTAHSLKSNAAAFGASGLSAACQVLEGLGAAGRLADAEVALRDVQGAYERLSRDLRALRQTLPARAPEYEL